MFARAAIVLLVALNLGVGLWWLLRPAPPVSPPPEQPAGVPRLQLFAEATPQARETAALAAESTPASDAPLAELAANDAAAGPSSMPRDGAGAPAPAACHRLGPFANTDALAKARAALTPQVRRVDVHATAIAPRGWRVVLPPQADRAAAQAVTARLAAAGFNDHFILSGNEANAIALGRFGSEDGARRHAAALQAAGFPAQAEAIGAVDSLQWIDLEADAGFDADAARRAVGAAQANPLDCAALR